MPARYSQDGIRLDDTYNHLMEITHVWGIAGKTKRADGDGQNNTHGVVGNEGWSGLQPVMSCKNRFTEVSRLFPGGPPAASRLKMWHIGQKAKIMVQDHNQPNQQIELSPLDLCRGLEVNKIITLSVNWEGHAICFNILRTRDGGYDLVYVNKGGRGRVARPGTAQVFHFPDQATGLAQLGRLIKAATEKDPSAPDTSKEDLIARVLNSYGAFYQHETSRTLEKSKQKVGNCTVANRNMSWHLYLAAQHMQQYPGTTLAQAYTATKPRYKQMRIADRALALISLLDKKANYTSASFDALLIAMLVKSNQKTLDGKNHNAQLLAFIQRNPQAAARLAAEVARLQALDNSIILSDEIAPALGREPVHTIQTMLSDTFERQRLNLERSIGNALTTWQQALQPNAGQRPQPPPPPQFNLGQLQGYRSSATREASTLGPNSPLAVLVQQIKALGLQQGQAYTTAEGVTFGIDQGTGGVCIRGKNAQGDDKEIHVDPNNNQITTGAKGAPQAHIGWVARYALPIITDFIRTLVPVAPQALSPGIQKAITRLEEYSRHLDDPKRKNKISKDLSLSADNKQRAVTAAIVALKNGTGLDQVIANLEKAKIDYRTSTGEKGWAITTDGAGVLRDLRGLVSKQGKRNRAV